MADPVLQSPKNPHFFQPLLPGFHFHLNIPVAFFSKHVEGRNEHKTTKLRSDASDKTWEVKIDGRRLTRGWKEFVTAHDLRIGDVIVFRHEGDLVFHVSALGPSCCEIQYTSSHSIDDDSDDHQDNIASRNISMEKRVKKNPRTKEESSSDHYCFVANVSVSSLREDKLYNPVSFARSNGLSKKHGKVVLLNEMVRSWKLSLDHDKSGVNTYLRHGWRSFCQVNGIKARDPFRFKLVGTGEKPVLRLCPAESNRVTRQVDCSEGNDVNSLSTNPSSGEESSETEESEEKSNEDISAKEENDEESIEDKSSLRDCLNIEKWKYCSRAGASSSPSQNRFVTLTITPYSIKSNKMKLPLCFTRVNGINKAGKITLLGQDGVNRMVHLAKENRKGRMRLGRDWKGFCEVHGVKIGESFVLELIWENDANPVLKFCTKVNCA